MTPEQLKARNAAIAEAQRRTWADPVVRLRRSEAIKQAWDDPLRRAIMSHQKQRLTKRTNSD